MRLARLTEQRQEMRIRDAFILTAMKLLHWISQSLLYSRAGACKQISFYNFSQLCQVWAVDPGVTSF